MALPQGLYFRASNNQTSPTNYEAEIGTTANYPRTTARGITVGWEAAPTGTRDRDATTDVRLKGVHFGPNSSNSDFRIDLPSAGAYNIGAAFGDTASFHPIRFRIVDSTTVLVDHDPGNVPQGQFADATGAIRTSESDWVTNNALQSATFSSTIFRMRMGGSISSTDPNWVITALYIESGAPSTPTGTFATTLNNSTIAAAGTVTNAGSFASTLGNATMAASGSVGNVPSGAFASTLDGFTMAATGTLNDSGTFASTLQGCSMAAAGIVAPNITGTITSNMDSAQMFAGGYVGTPPVIAGIALRRRLRPHVYQRGST